MQFEDLEEFRNAREELYGEISSCPGKSQVMIYLRSEKAKKMLPSSMNVDLETGIFVKLREKYGEGNVKLVEKSIEKLMKMH